VTVAIPIHAADSTRVGSLVLAQLPRAGHIPTVTGAAGQVIEGAIYRFEVRLEASPVAVVLEPSDELFSFDDETCLTGRFQPRQHVGAIRIRIGVPNTDVVGLALLEVSPSKLEYESEYRQMLGDIASVATDALLQGFAPSSLDLVQQPEVASRLLYQQFAFLNARLASREMRDAMALILADPHRAWHAETELQLAGRPLPGGQSLPRLLSRPGQRTPTHGRMRVRSVPVRLERRRTEASYDSVPNRFVKYALERWRAIAQHLIDLLDVQAAPSAGPVRRGRDAACETREQLQRLLAMPLFGQVGRLDLFPIANPVLHKRAGYRYVFETFALAEVGSRLSLALDIDDVFAASQRNAATLYEYWAFLQLVEAVGTACGDVRTVQALAEAEDGLSLGFKQGRNSSVKWEVDVGGRSLDVEVFFNRHFGSSRKPLKASSWSRAMRPDCSLRVRPRTHLPNVPTGSLDVWLHFDAKYRVDRAREQFDAEIHESESEAAEAETVERLGRSKREDLLKMHAYRDAIRGSAGAYVLFPGDDGGAPFREFGEPLPGLGAFPLRPSDDGFPYGREALQDFIREVLEHVADRATQDERYRYWRAVVRDRPEDGASGAWLPDLSEPPRDALVLCALLATADEYAWMARMEMCALPADSRSGVVGIDSVELRSKWALVGDGQSVSLWSRQGAWFVQGKDELAESGYPGPTASAFLCASFSRVRAIPTWLGALDLSALRDRFGGGRTTVVTWADVLDEARLRGLS
jgi:predicted component of viral defense system (DUF524 family)